MCFPSSLLVPLIDYRNRENIVYSHKDLCRTCCSSLKTLHLRVTVDMSQSFTACRQCQTQLAFFDAKKLCKRIYGVVTDRFISHTDLLPQGVREGQTVLRHTQREHPDVLCPRVLCDSSRRTMVATVQAVAVARHFGTVRQCCHSRCGK